MKQQLILIGGTLALVLATWLGGANGQPDQIRVRVDRWLELRRTTGNVQYQRPGQTSPQPAPLGTRLQQPGERLKTGKNSTALLALDTGIGFVLASEETTLEVQTITQLANGGRVTQIRIPQGQVRLQVRPLTNQNTRLEVLTPAGISGVRGTVFGVAVQDDGKTGIATLEGSVFARAQGQTVIVEAGFQSTIIPGQPPSPPTRIQADPRLDIQRLARIDSTTVEITGRIHPANLLKVMDQTPSVGATGDFTLRLPLPSTGRVTVTVTTPLGTQQVYELVVP